MIVELQLLLFLLYLLHVMFSNHIQVIYFLILDEEEEEEGGEVRWRSNTPASDSIREKKVCSIFIIFYSK